MQGETLTLHPAHDRARLWDSPRPVLHPIELAAPKTKRMAQTATLPTSANQ
ncbi:MAG: hypothetical protein U5N55_13235 [Cypionkella sp.]|nr:hypothetical protein [Cypionkella sp.]